MKLSKALDGLVLAKSADGLSPRTITSYRWAIDKLVTFTGDTDIEVITTEILRNFFVFLRDDYKPTGIRAKERLSFGSLYAVWRAVKSMWHWAHDELGIPRVDNVKMPAGEYSITRPFTEEEIRAILKAAERTTTRDTEKRKSFTAKRPTADRNVALLLLMLDCGLRVGEVVRLSVSDVNVSTGEIAIQPYSSGKKTHSRIVFVGKAARKALWRYLASRDCQPGDPLFLTDDSRRLDTNAIRHIMSRISKRTGIKGIHPHRFRHTFAYWFLRGGGNILTLQRMLGHNSLAMVKRYVALVDADLSRAMESSSPADRMRL